MDYTMTPAEEQWLRWITNKSNDEIARFPALLWKEAFERGRQLGRQEGLEGIGPTVRPASPTFEQVMETPSPKKPARLHKQKDLEINDS